MGSFFLCEPNPLLSDSTQRLIPIMMKKYSQGQSQSRGGVRQSHIRQAVQGCAIVSTDHGGDVGGSVEDQWIVGEKGVE